MYAVLYSGLAYNQGHMCMQARVNNYVGIILQKHYKPAQTRHYAHAYM